MKAMSKLQRVIRSIVTLASDHEPQPVTTASSESKAGAPSEEPTSLDLNVAGGSSVADLNFVGSSGGRWGPGSKTPTGEIFDAAPQSVTVSIHIR